MRCFRGEILGRNLRLFLTKKVTFLTIFINFWVIFIIFYQFWGQLGVRIAILGGYPPPFGLGPSEKVEKRTWPLWINFQKKWFYRSPPRKTCFLGFWAPPGGGSFYRFLSIFGSFLSFFIDFWSVFWHKIEALKKGPFFSSKIVKKLMFFE